MKENAKDKLTIYAMSFAFLGCGVAALQLDPVSWWRLGLLCVAFVGLVTIAVVQTVRRLKKK